MKAILVSLFFAFSVSAIARTHSPLPTAEHVDIGQYIGKWYAISALPQFFTKSCVAQSAEYKILSENSISVLNTCFKADGKTTDIKGKAVVVDTKTNARLELTFDNFFTKLFRVKGEYVIIKLSEGYDTVLVGSTDRKSLWILSRTPGVNPEVVIEYKNFAREIGFSAEEMQDSVFN